MKIKEWKVIMLQEERFEFIMSRLSIKGAVKVTDIAEELGISQSTIRRDIKEMHDQGRLKKVFGGAVLVDSSITTEDSEIAIREHENTDAKRAIGSFAASQITEKDFVFIDAGTTTRRIIPFIDESLKDNVTFVTNGVVHARELAARGFTVYVPSGKLKWTTEALVGTSAVDYISNCNFTKCFMGANAVDLKKGFTIPEIDESRLKSAVMRNSATAYVLVDRTKFNKISSVSFGKINSGIIITDTCPDKDYMDATVVIEIAEEAEE